MIPSDCVPDNPTASVVEFIGGPNMHGEFTFFEYWWNLSPAYCSRCGRCTNPNNVKPCGHSEAERHVRAQIFLKRLDQFSESQKDARTVDRRQ